MKITDALRGEHGVFYAQFDRFEQTLAVSSLAAIQAQGALLAAGLAPHAHIENEILFPTLEARMGGEFGPIPVMRAEHAEIESSLLRLQELRELTRAHDDIDGALARLPETRDVAEARQLVRQVLDTARDHFAKEENMLFPMAEEMLDAPTLHDLGGQWAQRRGVEVATGNIPS